MSTLIQDLRFALRMLAKNPGFTAVAVITLALGIGANTAMFTVIDSVLLRPVPFRDADRLVAIPLMVGQNEHNGSWSEYQDLRARSHLLQDIIGIGGDPSVLETPEGGQKVGRVTVTPNFLDVLGVHPMLGRAFNSQDYQYGAAPVVLLSAELWRSRFGADPHILGRLVRVGGVPYAVVGVMPDGFQFRHAHEGEATSSVWLPMPPSPRQSMQLAGRLKTGTTPQAAQAELAAMVHNLSLRARDVRYVVKPYRDALTESVRPGLLALSGALFLVLLIACVNVANLQLARFLSRRQELAVRAALGAGRGRLLRQLVAEGALLALAGAVNGLALAVIVLLVVHRLPPNFIPRANEIELRVPVFAMLAVFAAVTTILSSLAPALLATRTPPEEVLREGSGGSTAGRTRARWSEGMVAGEVALSAILLVSTGLMFHTLYNLEHIHFGFDLDRVTTFVAMPGNAPGLLGSRGDQKTTPPPESIVTRVYQPIADRLRQLPGVVDVGLSAWAPFDHNTMGIFFQLPGHAESEQEGVLLAQVCWVNSGYARAMGTPLIKGRMISDSDTLTSPKVAVVNEAFARRFPPGQDPIGENITLGRSKAKPAENTYTIVGILGDARQHDLTRAPDPEVLMAYQQFPPSGPMYSAIIASGTNYIVRTRGDVDLSSAIRQIFRQSASDFALDHFRTMRAALDEVTFNQRLGLYLICAFAGIAVVMVLSGLYGVLSQLVGRRRREIGIRMALGATRSRILTMILRRGLVLAVTGLTVGLPVSLAAGRLLSAFLYGVKPTDVSTFIFVGLSILGLSIGAALLPAHRATKVDPMVALRYE